MLKHFVLKNVKYCFLVLQIIIVAAFSFTSCKKVESFSKSNVTFSIDTLVFDTIFTTIGSTTQNFKIYNPDNKSIKIEEIELMGGKSSPFRINIDGSSGISNSDLILKGNDSMFVFVDVKLGVNGKNLPTIIEDSIRIRTNGKDQYMNLMVWGQDAYFHYKEVLQENTWKNDKPHVIVNYAAIDSANSLTIEAGTKIHLHKNAMLYVYKSQLIINGSKDKPVTFEGDRLESFYKEVSGQYYGIYLHEALSSTINYAIIKNGTSGIHVYSSNSKNIEPTLKISNTIIQNNSSYGVFLFSNPWVEMENTIVSKNGTYGVFILQGAKLKATHCNLLGYASSDENAGALAIKNNYTNPTNNITYVSPLNLELTNSVVYGFKEDEILFDTISGQAAINYNFNYCLLKKKITSIKSNFSKIIWNKSPLFKNVSVSDYHPDSGSPLFLNGIFISNSTTDLEGKQRGNPPTIGVYE
jgi:hypothetical protein